MLEWNSAYETGVPTIDKQHKVLFEHVNRLERLVASDEIKRSEADYVLTFLEDYVQMHFSAEETCMLRFRCPAYEKNKEDHALALNMLSFYKGQYEVTAKPKAMLERLHQSMVWWINHHILKVDIQLKDSVGTTARGEAEITE